MADETTEKKPSGSTVPASGIAVPAGVGAGGGIALGALGGAFISKLADNPAKAVEWILDHGSTGTFFFIAAILVLVVWRQQERIDFLQSKINGQDARYAVKVEELMGRLVDMSKVLVKLVTRTEAALRRVHLMEPERDDDDDEEDDPPAEAPVVTGGRRGPRDG